MIHPHPPHLSPPLDETWEACVLCGSFFHEVEAQFDAGTVEPIAAATATGAISGDTGKVVEVVLEGGSWAGSNAYGTIRLSLPSGVDENGNWGEDNETVTTPAGGSFTLNHAGIQKSYWRLWPTTQLIFRDGKKYCGEHYRFRFHMKDLMATPFNISDR